MLEIIEVKTKKDLKKFVKFPLGLYRGNPYFVPPLNSDEIGKFDPKKNGALKFCKFRIFIAKRENKVVGRICGIINSEYNKKTNRRQMRFSRFDVIDDFEVTKALFEAIKKYAKECDMNEIVGPMGFSDIDYQGMQVEGFDSLSMCITMQNYPYYKEHMEKLGFIKEVDWIEYRIKVPDKLDPRINLICEKVLASRNFEIMKFKNKKEMAPYIKKAIVLMNDVYSHLYGYVTQNDQQIKELETSFKLVLNPKFAVVIVKKDTKELIGYGLIAPSLSNAFRKCWGRLLPFGIFHLLRGIKKYDVVDLYSIGVKKEYQNIGVNAVILNEGIKACLANNVKYAETGAELESNSAIQAQWKNFEKEQHNRRRLYIYHL